jgi:GT2 family glycosyltransferase
MIMSLHDVSIVIVSYNCRNYLVDCLKSLENTASKYSYEVIVVDNASNDDTYNEVHPLFPHYTFIYNEKNLGFSNANNQGILKANGRNILLLNPDTVVLDKAIDTMVDFLDSNPDAGACGCRLLNDDGSLQPSYFGFPNIYKEIGHLLRIDRDSWIYRKICSLAYFKKKSKANFIAFDIKTSVEEVDYLLGACLMIKGDVIDKVGMLDDNIFMYIEDTEICFRIKKYGYKIFYLPLGQIIHHGGKSTATADKKMLEEYTRSRIYFYKKCYGYFLSLMLRIVIIIDMLIKMVLIWFKKPGNEMNKLQTRYKNNDNKENDKEQCVSLTKARYSSFKLYASILKMAISE